MKIRYNTLVLWLSALLLCSWWAFSQIEVRTDMSLFLPEGTAADQKLLLNEINQGEANRLLMIAIKQGDSAGRAQISQQFATQLRNSPFFERVENGTPTTLVIDPLLFKYRYLISTDDRPDNYSADMLNAALVQRLEELKSPFPTPFKDLLPADPLGTYQSMLGSWLAEHNINSEQGVWHSKDGEMALLLAQTKAGGMDLDQQQLVLSFIKTEFVRVSSGQPYELIVSGPGTFGVESRNIIHNESQSLSIIASILIALLLFSAYRFLPYLLIAALPLASALLAAAIVCQLFFGELHGITLAFGITLLGVTLDYPIHLFSHLRKEQSVKKSMLQIWNTMRLGVYTTCIAYLVLLTTDFSGLRQLGLFTLTGLLTAALTSRFILPQLFPVAFMPPKPRGISLLSRLLGQRRWPVLVLSTAAIISLASLLISYDTLWQDDIATLSPLPQALLKQDRQLRQQLLSAEPNQLMLIRGDDPESILQTSEALRERLKTDPEGQILNDIKLPSDYLPSEHKQRLRQRALPDSEQLSANLQQGLKGTPFRETAFKPFIKEIQESRRYSPLSYAQALETDLKPRLQSMIRQGPSDWFALIPLHTYGDSESIANYLNNASPEVRYLNMRSEISSLVGDFREQILQRIAFGSLLMLLLLWYGLGSLKAAFNTLIPIAAAILTTVGLLNLSGESLNLFHLISLMLVLGIGMDYSLFFRRREQQQGETLLTLHALSVCALSTAGVFAILASSSIPVLHAIGQTVAIGVAMSYLATYALSRRIS
ncbi:MAG: MMPL family transporter [Candidatus Thiodiazotropha sp. 6PLUC1]